MWTAWDVYYIARMKCFPANVPTIKRPLSTRPGTNMASQHYCLRWNNYQSNMTSVFHQLLQDEAFVDVTLACNEASLKAHKVVLSACSPFFQKLLLENPCKHPVIIMPQDVCYSDLKFIIEFVYKGEIDVSQAELQSLLKTADQLKIKGLCEVSDKNAGGSDGVTSLPISRRSFTKLRLSGYKRRCVDQVMRAIYSSFSVCESSKHCENISVTFR
ncbi:hypothetical protein J437_LFUL013604 [Ladona fulva]|uniref:BTB domain-containing protein n=1 Tax=Ladona fulva TaxID=123851 RepID=A0A8K0P651_LADFU|nr:hypothetical protein J437_LFUL013604 [Ladona fulva]